MSTTETGGPAFPQIDFFDEKPIDSTPGMTLHDYHAAHCPITFSEFLKGWPRTETASAEEAMDAYAVLRCRYADSMLKARKV